MSIQRQIVLVLAVLAIVVAVVNHKVLRGWARISQPASSVTPWRPPGYVGDESCAGCHADIAKSYARCEMANSWGLVSESRHVEPPATVHDNKSGMSYEMQWREDRLFVREFRLNNNGEEIHSLEVEATHHIGSGRHGRAYATNSDGYLTKIPVGWYADFSKWDMGPGYETTNLRFDRPIIPECVGCHGSFPSFIAGTENKYRQPLPGQVGCERCHGPGADHVAARAKDPAAAETRGDGDPTIVNPARLPVELAQDVCLQCHLQAEIMVDQPGVGLIDYRPGQRLRDFRSYFFSGDQDPAKPASVGHVPRSHLSRCYVESGGKMTCFSCHDVHRALDEIPAGFYNNACLNCHGERGCSRSLAAGEAPLGDCVKCHMPRVASGDIGHAVTTEHWIRRDATQGALVETTKAAASSPPRGFFGDEADGQIGAAIVRSVAHRSDPQTLRTACELLETAVNRQPEALSWRIDLATGYFHAGRFADAIRLLEHVTRVQPDSTEAWDLLGQSYGSLGQFDRSVESFEQAIRRQPDYAGADFKLALLYLRQDRMDKLLDASRRYFERHPDNPRVLGLVAQAQYTFARQPRVALATLERARGLDPSLVALSLLEARIASELGDERVAEGALRRALDVQPDLVPAYLQLGTLLVRQRRLDDARKVLMEALKLQPANAEIHRMIQQLR